MFNWVELDCNQRPTWHFKCCMLNEGLMIPAVNHLGYMKNALAQIVLLQNSKQI